MRRGMDEEARARGYTGALHWMLSDPDAYYDFGMAEARRAVRADLEARRRRRLAELRHARALARVRRRRALARPLCRFGLHEWPRHVDAHTQAPAPVRCYRCGVAR